MKKGFTLIELLAVIIILAVIALIATPIVLDVVENAKEESRLQSVNGLIDATRLYTNEAMLKEKLSLEGNLYDAIKTRVGGKIPDTGEIYVNENKQVAIAIQLDKYCYVKKYNGEITKTESEDCTINNIVKDICYDAETITYDINYDVCVEMLTDVMPSYTEAEKDLVCKGGAAIDGLSIEGVLAGGMFTPEDLESMNAITNLGKETKCLSCFMYQNISGITDEIAIYGYRCYEGNPYGMPTITDVTIPTKLNSSKVTKILGSSFGGKNLTNINLNNAIYLETIGEWAFYNNQLDNVDFSNLTNLKTIVNGAFSYNQLTSLDLSGLVNLEILGERAFENNYLTEIKLNDLTKLKIIENQAFRNNQLNGTLDLSSLTNLETIGDSAFFINNLEKVKLPSSSKKLKIIGEQAFSYNELSGTLDLSGLTNLETIGQSAFFINNLEKVKLPSSVTSIGHSAFSSSDTTDNETLTLPDGTTKEITYYNNPNLTKIVNPTGLAFDWYEIIRFATGTPFETGSVITSDNRTIMITSE